MAGRRPRRRAATGCRSPSPHSAGCWPSTRRTAPGLTREGDSYRLALPDDSECDVWQFERPPPPGGRPAAPAESPPRRTPWPAALAVYGGPLLRATVPPTGSSSRRAAPQHGGRDAAARLANLRLGGPDRAATEAARAGLSLDRYRDELWELLIEAADRSGHHAEAGQARRAYAAVLDELGV